MLAACDIFAIRLVDNDIRMTCDVPSRNVDRKIAVLDMKVGVKGDQLFFEFFEKSMTRRRIQLFLG